MMTITLSLIADLHKELNAKFFNNELTTPNFGFAKSRTFCGQFCYSKRLLRISTLYNWSMEHLRHTVCHEMIHQRQKEMGKFGDWHRDRGHGYWFQYKAREIHRIDPSINIQRCHNMTAYDHELKAEAKASTAMSGKILIFTYEGRRGAVKVTPNNATRIKWFEQKYDGKYYAYEGIALANVPTPKSNARTMTFHCVTNKEWEEIQPHLKAI